MWYVAFTLGLFGSLHCVGMCGPLAIAFCGGRGSTGSKYAALQSGLGYNAGRTFTYTLLGLLFGLLGSFLFLADLQKVLSVVLGLVLIISFLLSIDLEKYISSTSLMKTYYQRVTAQIGSVLQQSSKYPPFVLGMANGLLPCGLVYLALAGALATGGVVSGMIFMALFGLGTVPMLLALTTGSSLVAPGLRMHFRKVLPYVTLCFGVFLIYRGVVVDMPTELNFWEALRNPVMCH